MSSDILRLWDTSSKKDRKKLLREFIQTHDNLTGPELDSNLEHTAPLLLARLYKVTPYQHEDRPSIKRAKEKIESALEQMNKVRKEI